MPLHRMRSSAHDCASDFPEFPPRIARAVLDFHSRVHFDRGHAQHAGPRCERAHALLGQSPPWTRRFFRRRLQSQQARSAGHAYRSSDLLPNCLARSGGTQLMLRSLKHLAVFVLFFIAPATRAQSGGVLHFCWHGEPKTFNPILVDDEASENVRYLTGGVLIRVNRQTQALEPALAESWQVSRDGRKITFHLRKGVYFSDGTPFSSADVGYTMKLLMDPQTHSATGDAFRSGEGTIDVQTPSPDVAVISFPTLVAGLDRLFDQVAILSAKSLKKEMSVLGQIGR